MDLVKAMLILNIYKKASNTKENADKIVVVKIILT